MKAPAAIDFNEPNSAKHVGVELESTATSLAVRVGGSLAITDRATLEQAVIDRDQIGDAIKRVQEFFAPLKQMADKLHKAICAREREILDPLRKVDEQKAGAIREFNAAEQRERRRREEEEAAARRRDDEARAAAEAAQLEQQGEHELAAAVVAEAIAAPAPVVTLPDATAGVVTFTRRWHWKYQHGPANVAKTPPQLVMRTLALVPKEFLMLDEKKVGAYARSMKSSGHIPGVDIYYTDEPNR